MRVTAETKNATRARILEVAQKLFAHRGFEATTTRDIARAAQIATGTLFNYFPTKESIVELLVSDASVQVAEAYATAHKESTAELRSDDAIAPTAEPQTLEEALFAHVALTLRKLKPYRKYLPVVLETSLSPLKIGHDNSTLSLRASHLETVSEIVCRHAKPESLSTVAMQLYWALFMGVLTFWSNDRSPRQEDTLALVDQSLAMFVGWLTELSSADPADISQIQSTRK